MTPHEQDYFWKRIDQICDLFESALQADEDAAIEDWSVDAWPDEQRQLLLRELLAVEHEFRSRPGRSLNARRTRLLFPRDSRFADDYIRRREPGASQQAEADAAPRRSSAGSTSDRSYGSYELVAEIARGGMGIVYRARHKVLGRTVALKIMAAGALATPEEVRRFQSEARAAAKLDHPHIVPVFDVGEADGKQFFTMGFVEGGDLNSRVSENLYAPREAAAIVAKLADAVDYAHQQGVLHRDLKPANVLIDSHGEPRLTDFGLAKHVGSDSTRPLTQSGQLLGTPSFMAPEQATGDHANIGPASDVYALGAILYFMLTGRPPFRAASMFETLREVLHEEPVSPRAITPGVDRDLETICLVCLAKEVDGRYPTAARLRDDLRRYLEGHSIVARPVGPLVRGLRWCRRNPVRTVLLTAATVLLIAGFVVARYRRDSQQAAARLVSANELADSRQETAETAEYYRLLQKASALEATHEPGWTWEVENLLSDANRLKHALQDAALLRSRVIAATTSLDLRQSRSVADDILPGAMCFSGDGRSFAVGESINDQRPRLLVFDVGDFHVPRWEFSFDSSAARQQRIARGLSRVDDGFRALAFSADGRWLAAGTRFGQVLVYDLADEQAQPRVLEVLPDVEVSQVAFSHDSELLYALSRQQIVKQWRNFTDEQSLEGDVRGVAVDPRGRRVIVLFADEFKVFRQLGESATRTISEGLENSSTLSITPDGRRVAVAVGREVLLFDLRSEKLRWSRLADPSASSYVATSLLSNDGEYVFAPGRDWLRIWDVSSGELLYRIAASSRHLPIVATDPQRQFLAVRSGGPAQLYELRVPKTVRKLTGLPAKADTVTHQNGTLTAVSESFSPPRVSMTTWDVLTGEAIGERVVVHDYDFTRPKRSHVAGHGSRRAFTVASLGIVVWGDGDAESPRILTPLGNSLTLGTEFGRATTPAESANRRAVDEKLRSPLVIEPEAVPTALNIKVSENQVPATWERIAVSAVVRVEGASSTGPALSGALVVHELESGAERVAPAHAWDASEFHGTESALLVLCRAARDTLINGAEVRLELPPRSASIERLIIEDVVVSPLPSRAGATTRDYWQFEWPAFSDDGNRLWAVFDDDKLCSWDINAPTLRTRWETAPEWLLNVYDVEVAEHWIYTASRNGAVQLTDPATGQIETEIPVSTESLNNIDVADDESWMIVSGDAGEIELIELPGGRLISRIAELGRPVTAQALSRNSQLLATGDAAGHCVLWQRRADAFERLVELGQFANPITQVAFSQNGRSLSATVMDHPAVMLFDLHAVNEQFARFDVGSPDLSGSRTVHLSE